MSADPIVTITPPTPEQELKRFEKAMGRLPDDMRARFFEAQLYRGGDTVLADLHFAGRIKMKPQGVRVLLRAILQEDASVLSLSGELAGQTTEYNAKTCVAHVIEDIGPGVAKYLADERGYAPEDMPKIGDHCFVLSTVADRTSKTSMAVRLWTVHVDDVALCWRPT